MLAANLAEAVTESAVKPKRTVKTVAATANGTAPTATTPGTDQGQARPRRRAAAASTPVITPETDQAADRSATTEGPRSTPPSAPVVYRTPPATADAEAEVADVYALPNYEKDGRTDRDSREWVGQVLNTRDWMRQVAALYGGGYYYFLPRKRDGKFGTGITTYVAPLAESPADDESGEEIETAFDFESGDDSAEITAQQLRQRNLQLEIELARLRERERLRAEFAPAAGTPSAQNSLSDQLDLLLKLDQLRGQPATPAPPPQPKPPQKTMLEQLQELEAVRALLTPKTETQANPTPLAGDSLTSVVLALVNGAKGEDDRAIALSAVQRLLGVDAEPQRPFWQELVLSLAQNQILVESVSPLIALLTQAAMGQMAQATAAQNAVTPTQPQAATTAPQPQPAATNPSAPANKAGQAMTPEAALEVVIDEWKANRPINRAAAIVQQLLKHPEYGTVLQSMLTADPAETVTQLGVMYPDLPKLPHVETWLRQLIKAFSLEPPPETISPLPSHQTTDDLASGVGGKEK